MDGSRVVQLWSVWESAISTFCCWSLGAALGYWRWSGLLISLGHGYEGSPKYMGFCMESNKLISMNSESELHSFERARTPQTQGSHPFSDYYGCGLEGLIIFGCQRSLYLFITTGDWMSERTHWLLYHEQYIKNVNQALWLKWKLGCQWSKSCMSSPYFMRIMKSCQNLLTKGKCCMHKGCLLACLYPNDFT